MIHPTKGEVVAPFDGTVMTLFPTKHAIGLISDNGLELLIHIGLDTVQTNGQYFEAHVKQGDRVTRGQKLITFDKDALIKAGFNIETPVLVTNSADYLDIIESDKNEVACSDDLITALVQQKLSKKSYICIKAIGHVGRSLFVSRLIRKQRVFVLKIFIVGWFSDNR